MATLFLRSILKLGKSRGVVIPPKLADQLRLKQGCQVQWLLRDGKELVLRNVDRSIREAVNV